MRIIIKKRTKPESILFLKRGTVRIKKRRRDLEHELRNIEQGYQAECELDFYLRRIGIDSQDVITLHDLRLPSSDGHTFFQIDTLLLTPQFGFIIDVKSQAGQLFFQNNARNFRYSLNEQTYQMTHPITQIDEQRDQLRWWLGQKWVNYPFINVVGLADPNAKIVTDTSSDWVQKHVMPFHFLKETFKRAGKKNTKTFFQKSEMVRVGHQLAKAHTPPKLNFAKKFDLNRSDVLNGTICPHCHQLAMKRLRVIWECPHCEGRDRRAHVMSLRDYFIFVKSTITNPESREFLGVDNEHTARTLLVNSGIVDWHGHKKGRVYYLKK